MEMLLESDSILVPNAIFTIWPNAVVKYNSKHGIT